MVPLDKKTTISGAEATDGTRALTSADHAVSADVGSAQILGGVDSDRPHGHSGVGFAPDRTISDDFVPLRLHALWDSVAAGLHACGEQSRGLATRLLMGFTPPPGIVSPSIDIRSAVDACRYGGAPAAALTGFGLGAESGLASDAEITDVIGIFVDALGRLAGRSPQAQRDLSSDDVSLLGIADGIAASQLLDPTTSNQSARLREWALGLIKTQPTTGWSARIRSLAGDILDGRGRLRARADEDEIEAVVLDLALRRSWPVMFAGAPEISASAQRQVIERLLRDTAPPPGAVENVAARLAALESFVSQTAGALLPTVGEVARILRETQGALRRWVWENKPGRSGVAPARWLIDDEAHVQALLWTVLYPRFGAFLRGEEYLPGHGQKQPRADFGITSLKLIVEVKIARSSADFRRIEEEVAGDLGVYFTAPERFDRMIVYVYDDSDVLHAERHATLRHALMQRDTRIEEVVVVVRPGMIPRRGDRGTPE